jgi:hypothetical protein
MRAALTDVLAETGAQLSGFQPLTQLFEIVFSAQVAVLLYVVLSGRGVLEASARGACLFRALGSAAVEVQKQRLLSRAVLLAARTAEVGFASLPAPLRDAVAPLAAEPMRRVAAAVLTLMWDLVDLGGGPQLGGAETIASALRTEERAYAEPCALVRALCAALGSAAAAQSARALVADCSKQGVVEALRAGERRAAVVAWLEAHAPRPVRRAMAWCPRLTARLAAFAVAAICGGDLDPKRMLEAMLQAESPVLYEAYRTCTRA